MKTNDLVLLLICFSFSCAGCKSKNQSVVPQKQDEPEDYINPTPSNPDNPEDPVDPVIPEPIYDEITDSTEGIDVSDMSGLYTEINKVNDNYTSTIKGYFNEEAVYYYYCHYRKNYVCNKTSYYLENVQYTLPDLDEYLPVCNMGYMNRNSNYYKFSLQGSSKEERMSYVLKNEDLTDEVSNKRYQDDLFTISDLNETYFTEKGFTRISEHKYQCTDRYVCEDFVSICSPDLINEGYYMTFSRVTIETNPDSEHTLRIRLYSPDTQIGKFIDSHRDETNKPNWYLLFSEALIGDVGTTTFAPASSLLS